MQFDDKRQLSLPDALRHIPAPNGNRFAELFRHGTLSVEIYAPIKDEQLPHMRDEVYVVVRGSGVFIHGDKRLNFQAGDFLFAAAGEPHKFVEFSEDFCTWVFFYGTEGGEAACDPEWMTGDD